MNEYMKDGILIECTVIILIKIIDLYIKGTIDFELFIKHVEKKKLFLENILTRNNFVSKNEIYDILKEIDDIYLNNKTVESNVVSISSYHGITK